MPGIHTVSKLTYLLNLVFYELYADYFKRIAFFMALEKKYF